MGEDKKDNLIQAALMLFEEQGYHTTKISDIVREAGVAQGTFYLYFKSKEDMFRSIAEACLEEIVVALQQGGVSKDTDEQKDYLMIRRALEVYHENKTILKIINRHGVGSQEIAGVSEAFYQQIMMVIKQALRDEAMYANYSEDQLEIIAFSKIGMVEMVAYQWFVVKNCGSETINALAQIIVGDLGPCKFKAME
ncbi:TetR/AcrR family transcriptional regulator [Paenibacillus agricola]|uniref:TetR/AcrR family transcriptional regulator n=1 Tax=Paenibacillus agricola TaxID=2716264 RepID=A0ABX0J6Y7_9BACL|nr:TetR/AcrR family transcriptional regulator [Paenibacillus agricola]NHN31551.1 TetR/AcrR family transcriptional regulator [Paenibacillus agricola]